MSYQVPQYIDPNKVFLINHSELEERLEPEFYRPSIAFLEKDLRARSSHKLKDFALSMAGGSTPSKTEADKYYTDSSNGIPFLRVQNLQVNGELALEDCVYINEYTHKNLLKRSQVSEGDLLVKITGVGRMAIASVAPKGFVGNTNQHMVVIKTGDESLSKYLARYLNLDIIEKIASRHSTGGTRPALDYPSLKNLPVIENIDFSAIDVAISKKQQKEEQAKALLQSIDEYLLSELGIHLPETKSQTIQDRMFVVNFSELSGDRLDVEYNNPHKHGAISKVLKSAKYSTALLSFLAKDIFQGVGKDETNDSTYVLLKVKNILRGNMIDYSDVEFVKSVPQNKLLLRNDIISPFIGEAVRQIKFSLFDKEEYRYTVDNNTGVIRLKESVNAQYVCEYLCSCLGKMQIERLIGGGGVPFLGSSGAKKLNIIIPPLQKQQEIVDHISSIRQQAKALQEEGKAILEQAKKEVEHMILG